VVTGASAGVGRAIAVELASRGDRVALLARGDEGLAAAAQDVERAGGTALPVQVDVADPDAVEEAAARVERTFGAIDVWVNTAFASVFALSWDIEPGEYHRITQVTYLGYVYGTLAALKRMRPRGSGTVVQVGSALAYRGIPLQAAYCGAKHAIQGFNESVRCELLHEHSPVHVTMVQLPAVNTPQFGWVLSRLPGRPRPVAPIYEPEVAARAVAHATEHPGRRERWVGGSTAATIMANAVVPGLLDRYLARTGFDAQQDDEPPSPQQTSDGNLWRPRDARQDRGSHGQFDDSAWRHSAQQWVATRPVRVAAAAGLVAGAVGWFRRRR